jgi:hypothetical protein
MTKRSPCPLFAITGTVATVGPTTADDDGTTYQYLVIREKGGGVRHLTIVRAVAEIAAIIERHAIGIFLFWEQQGEPRLCYVYRADGPRQVDLEAVRDYLMKQTWDFGRICDSLSNDWRNPCVASPFKSIHRSSIGATQAKRNIGIGAWERVPRPKLSLSFRIAISVGECRPGLSHRSSETERAPRSFGSCAFVSVALSYPMMI